LLELSARPHWGAYNAPQAHSRISGGGYFMAGKGWEEMSGYNKGEEEAREKEELGMV